MAQAVESMPVMRETQLQSLGREDPLEKKISTHSSILAWKVAWMEAPGGLGSDTTERLTLLLLAAVTVVINFATWVLYPISLAEGFRQ